MAHGIPDTKGAVGLGLDFFFRGKIVQYNGVLLILRNLQYLLFIFEILHVEFLKFVLKQLAELVVEIEARIYATGYDLLVEIRMFIINSMPVVKEFYNLINDTNYNASDEKLFLIVL